MKISCVENLNSMQIIQKIYSLHKKTDTCHCIALIHEYLHRRQNDRSLHEINKQTNISHVGLPETIRNALRLIHMDLKHRSQWEDFTLVKGLGEMWDSFYTMT